MRMEADHLSADLLGPVEHFYLRHIAMESNSRFPPPFFFCFTLDTGTNLTPLIMTSPNHVQLLSRLVDLRAIKVCYSEHDEETHWEREFLLRKHPCPPRPLAEYEWKVLDPSTSTVESRNSLTLEHLKLEELPLPPKYSEPWTSYKYPVETSVLSTHNELQISRNSNLPPSWKHSVKRTIDDTEERENENGRMLQTPKKQPRLTMRGGAGSARRCHESPITPESPSSGIYQTPEPERSISDRESTVATEAEILGQLNEEAPMSTPTPAPRSRRVEPELDQDEEPNSDDEPSSDPSEDASEDISIEYEIERFRAERQTPKGLEILVEWKEYPFKKDWTWETEESLSESVPHLVAAWHSRSDLKADEEDGSSNEALNDDGEIEIYEVEKVLARRNFRGILHYLVEWKGFLDVEDRTWEEADTLMCDVPLLVEEYENQRGRGRKR